MQLRFDLLQLFCKDLYRDKIDGMYIDDVEVLAIGELVVRDKHALMGDQPDLPAVREVLVDLFKSDLGRCQDTVEVLKRLDIACHRIGEIIQDRGHFFGELGLLKEKKVRRVVVEKGFEGALKLRMQVLFMDIPYQQGKLFREEVLLLMVKFLREESRFKNR